MGGLLRRVLSGEARGPLAQLARYVVSGGTAFVADFTTLALLKESGLLGLPAAVACGFAVGVTVNYTLATRWVFHRRRVADRRLELAAFTAIGLGGLALNEGLIWALTRHAGVHYLLAKCAAAAVVLGWSFTVRRLTLFRDA